MIKFDEEKLRDTTWKDKFYQKLAEIRALQREDSYIQYATHREIVNELKEVYVQNLEHYQSYYQQPKEAFEDLCPRIDQLRSKLHPEHFTQLIDLQKEIEKLLAVNDYAINARAIPMIRDLEDRMQMYISQMEAYRFNLKDLQEQLDTMQQTLWLEEVEEFEKRYQRYKNGIQGDQLPKDVLIFDKEKVKSLALDRTLAVEEFLEKARSFKKLSRDIKAKEGIPFSKKEFEEFNEKLERARKKRQILWISGAVIGGTLIILGGIFGPQWYRSAQMKDTWEKLQIAPSYMGYEHFIERFEEGPLVAAAQQAKLDLTQGKIEGYTDNLGNVFDYDGDLSQGHPDGTGTATYPSGEVYQGEWEKGVRQGIGSLIAPDGSKYEGQWKNNVKSGNGTQTYSNGDKYEGSWEDGVQQGEGTLMRADSSLYAGMWVEGQFEGEGTMKYSDGSRYEGQWKDGKREGNGMYFFTNGMRYEGNWKNGNREGRGNLIWPDGKIFRGNWQNDLEQGEGTINWANGGVFVGNWVEGKLNGTGSFTSRFRETYEGTFKEDTSEVIVLYDSLGNEVRRGKFTKGMYVISR